jgi:hypothetical protein
MSLPGEHDFTLYRGDSDRISYQFLEADTTPVDLTGSTVTLTARHRLGDALPALTLEATFSSPTTGDFYFDVLPEMTKKVGAFDRPAAMFYDMQYTHQTTIITIVYGKLTILPEVTR